MGKTAETHRPQALPYRQFGARTISLFSLRRSLKVKFLCLSVYLCTFGLRSGVAAQELFPGLKLAILSERFTQTPAVSVVRQQCLFSTAGYVGPRSPDHADAVIWGLTELMLGPPVGENLFEYYGGILAESRV